MTGRARAASVALAAWLPLVAGCGGGGGGGSPAPPPAPAPAPATIDYPNSIALGGPASQDIAYTPAASTSSLPIVRSATAATLLAAGDNAVVAEHADATLTGERIVCVSGNGQTTNVVTNINLGVIAESAAVLLDATWTPVDAPTAWAAAASRATTFAGWENCGVKPEGLPSRSSQLRVRTDGGYDEDTYDGNPGTTFNVISRSVASSVVAAMLSPSGYATVGDAVRPLVLTLRAYRNAAGSTILVERGEPQAGAPAATRGFIALYLPAS